VGLLIGSVMAFAGPVPADPAELDAWEQRTGWLLCDGRLLDRTDPVCTPLNDVIGGSWGGDNLDRFNIPDLRGLFLRGVDWADRGRDPDGDARQPIARNGNGGRAVGSLQGWGTALPLGSEAFVMEPHGRHTHRLAGLELDASRDVDGQNNTVAYPGSDDLYVDNASDHDHPLSGGSRETRPANAYVHWLICFRE